MSQRQRSRLSTQRVTMTDVASLANVSASTVSLYLRKPNEVSSALGRRIQQAIDHLGYVPNLMAGALAAAKTRVIGVVVPSMVNSMFSATVSEMQSRLSAQGYQLLLGHSGYSIDQEEALVKTFLSWSPSAMVLTGLKHTRRTKQMLSQSDIPIVEMWELGSNPLDFLVGFSHLNVGRAQTRHLIERGCKKIAFIGARMEIDCRAGQRADGYSSALLDFLKDDCPIIIDVGNKSSAEASSKAFAQLIEQKQQVDGIIFSNDLLALGAIFEAQRLNIRIPEEIAIIGFGDMDFSSSSLPSITTVRPYKEQIGAVVAETLLSNMPVRDETQESVCDLGFDVIVRDSTAFQSIDK